MFSIQVLLSFLLAVSLTAFAQDTSWHITKAFTLANEMLDPIVNPNGQSSHMHKIIGGSSFRAGYSFDLTQTSKCSTVPMQADKSNYWMPNLYTMQVLASGQRTYTSVPVAHRFYYFLGTDSPNQVLSPFPEGLRMLAGSPENKDPSKMGFASFSCQINSAFTGSLTSNNFNFGRDCPFGMRVDIIFPQCWDGKTLYSEDGSHVARVLGGNARDGICPLSHPVRMPTIMLEMTFLTDKTAPGQKLAGNVAWANGDTTGYGLHGDFINGWDTNVLAQALNSSACGTGVGNPTLDLTFDQCPIIGASYDLGAAGNCVPDAGVLANPGGNDDLIALSSLPGCNPLWGASGAKPTCNPAVPAQDVSAFTTTIQSNQKSAPLMGFSLPSNNTAEWTSIACASSPAGSLSPYVSWSDNKAMTATACKTSCQQGNYQYAAVGVPGPGYFSCMCSNTLNTATAYSYPNMCNTPCPGNATESCGSSTGTAYEIFYNPNSNATALQTTTTALGSTYMGCLATKAPRNVTYSFSSAKMTIEVCNQACVGQNASYAATYAGINCICGNDFSGLTGFAYMPDSSCGTGCSGNSTEHCGGSVYSSVYNVKATSTGASTTHGPGWQGCYGLNNGAAPLSTNIFSSPKMTQGICVNGCSEMGFSQAAIIYGNQCLCGNSATLGQSLPVSQCSLPCSGDSTQVCGGGAAFDLYSTASYDTLADVGDYINATSPYVGCYTALGSGNTLANYSYTSNTMSNDVCVDACEQFGYAYAGVSGTNCQCGNTKPATKQVVTPLWCTKPCAGAPNEVCGNNGYFNIFSTTGSVGSWPSYGNTTTNTTTSDPSYVGCYSNSPAGLNSYQFSLGSMTNDLCRTSCKELGYGMAGTTAGNICMCGNSWTGGGVLPLSSCSSPCAGSGSQMCGASKMTSVYKTAGAKAIPTQPTGWLGCYSDAGSVPTLNGWNYTSGAMTSVACTTACANQGYKYAGTEGSVCNCGNTLAANERIPQVLCSITCPGDSTQQCGGQGKISVFNSTSSGSTSSTGGATSSGTCYYDMSALTGPSYSSDWMSLDLCGTWCAGNGQTYAGVQNGQRCVCGTTSPKQVAAASLCQTTKCSANSAQYCGSSSNAIVVKVDPTKSTGFDLTANSTGYIGCFQGGSTPLMSFTAFSSASMTTLACAQNCLSTGYAYAGVTNGQKCLCGNSLNIKSGGYQIATADCSTPCPGGGGTFCGGPSQISAYTTALVPGAKSALRSGELGCFAPGTMYTSPPVKYTVTGMTPTLCRQDCLTQGYIKAAVTAGNACMCSNSTLWGAQQGPSTCNVACSGDSTQMCGGASNLALNVFNVAGVTPISATGNMVGCFNDPSGNILTDYMVSASNMSATMCQQTCTARGYPVAGVYAKSCYCGKQMPKANLYPSNQCNLACPGNSQEICGAIGRLSVYSATYAKQFGQQAQVISSSSTTPATIAKTTTTTTTKATTTTTTSLTTTSKVTTTTTSTSTKPVTTTSSTTSTKPTTTSTTTTKATTTTSTTTPVTTTTTKPATTTPTTKATTTTVSTMTTTAGGDGWRKRSRFFKAEIEV